MKKLIAIIIGGFIGLSSCTDLDPKLYSDLTTSNAYNSEDDINAALVGVYADLGPYPGDGWLYYCSYMVATTDYSTDMGYSPETPDLIKLTNYSYDANNRYIKNNWQNMYQVISNANLLMDKIENVDMDADKKNLVIAQAKFCRALSYRDITDGWGPAPLVAKFELPQALVNRELTSVEDIDKVLLEDLKFCINTLPEKWTAEQGLARATRGAAATLAGKILMRSHDYTNAKTYIDMVLDLQKKGVYKLNPDFKEVWSESNKQDGGSIFCILHEATQNGGEITNHFGPKDHPEVQNRWAFYTVSPEFWRKYDKRDPRREFFYYDYIGRDKGQHYLVPESGQKEPGENEIFLQGLATMKYSYGMVDDSYYDGRTISIFRLADIILCKAEIENELTSVNAALPYLNEVRHRAGAPEYGKDPEFPIPASKEAMKEAILAERGFELVFEYQRRPDLIRFGKLEEVTNEFLRSKGLPAIVTAKNKYFPYPLVEALLNTHMTQENPNRLP